MFQRGKSEDCRWGAPKPRDLPWQQRPLRTPNTQQQRECFDWSLFYQPGTSVIWPSMTSIHVDPYFLGENIGKSNTIRNAGFLYLPKAQKAMQLVVISSNHPFPPPINQPRSHHPTVSFFFRHCHRCYRTATLHVAMLPTSASRGLRLRCPWWCSKLQGINVDLNIQKGVHPV